jgi:hypothetical protein
VTDDVLELVSTVRERVPELLVLERRKWVVPASVEPDLEVHSREPLDLLGAQARVCGIGPHDSLQGILELGTVRRRQRLDLPADIVNVTAAAFAEPNRPQIEAEFHSGLEALPPKPIWTVKRRTAQKEGRRRTLRREDRRDDVQVRAQIVVEGDRDREALAGSPFEGVSQELARAHDLVVGTQMTDLIGEERRPHCRNQLTPRIARRILNAVVHERDPDPPVGSPCQPRGESRKRQSDEPKDFRASAAARACDNAATPPVQ